MKRTIVIEQMNSDRAKRSFEKMRSERTETLKQLHNELREKKPPDMIRGYCTSVAVIDEVER